MADASYQPKVYRKQGGSEFIVASSGELAVESGGKIDLESGSTMTVGGALEVASGAQITVSSGSSWVMATPLEFSSGGYTRMPVVAKAHAGAATNIVAGTVNVITASSTADSVCALPAPSAGAVIFAICAARTSPGTYTLSSTKDFIGTAQNKLKFDAANERGLLISGTTAWIVAYATAHTTS